MDPTKSYRDCPSSKQVINDCDFGACRPRFLKYGYELVGWTNDDNQPQVSHTSTAKLTDKTCLMHQAALVAPPTDFRCWDSCSTIRASTQCAHFNGAWSVDTLLYSSESAETGRRSMGDASTVRRLLELTRWIDGVCDPQEHGLPS